MSEAQGLPPQDMPAEDGGARNSDAETTDVDTDRLIAELDAVGDELLALVMRLNALRRG